MPFSDRCVDNVQRLVSIHACTRSVAFTTHSSIKCPSTFTIPFYALVPSVLGCYLLTYLVPSFVITFLRPSIETSSLDLIPVLFMLTDSYITLRVTMLRQLTFPWSWYPALSGGGGRVP